jgi:ATP-dependent Clp protease ATP-binding subunit ClpC
VANGYQGTTDMFERFTERARKVMSLAKQEAHHHNHKFVCTEHILLGLLKEGRGLGPHVLCDLGVDMKQLRDEVRTRMHGESGDPEADMLPMTDRAKKVSEVAVAEARELQHSFVGTEHILLGLVSADDGVTVEVLNGFGVKPDAVRADILKLLAAGEDIKEIADS